MAFQKVKTHKRDGRPVGGYTRRKRPKSLKVVRRRTTGNFRQVILQNKYGEILGTKLEKLR